MPTARSPAWIVFAASAAAFVMLAQLLAGKAARDALFLSTFGANALPYAIAAAGVVSLAGAIPASRALARFGPARTVPWLFVASAALFLAQWLLSARAPELVAGFLYLHLAAASALLISGFWATLNERFDPRTARAGLPRVASFATLGGVAGGLISERVSAFFGLEATLLVMAGMHAVCALLLATLGGGVVEVPEEVDDEAHDQTALSLFRSTPYLRLMLASSLMLAVMDALLDFAIRAGADAAYTTGEELVRFFGFFYTAVGVATFLVQTGLTSRALARFGIGPAMSALPGAVAVVGGVAVVLPGMVTVGALRAVGSVLANSVYRTGFELLYTPLPVRIKRPTKTYVDVGGQRLGDVLGAGLILLVIALLPDASVQGVTAVAVVLSVALVAVLLRLQSAYREQLARNLQRGEISLDAMDSLARNVAQTHVGLDRLEILAHIHEARLGRTEAGSRPVDGDAAALVDALADPARAPGASATLRSLGASATPELLGALADPGRSEVPKLLLPAILAEIERSDVVEGLLAAMGGTGFEVRFRCARAAARIVAARPELRPTRERVLDALRDEIANEQAAPPPTAAPVGEDRSDSILIADLPRLRVRRAAEHVCTLLSLSSERALMRSVLLGLHSDEGAIRGTAVEYLEVSLPDDLRRGLGPVLGARVDAPVSRRVRAVKQLEAELLRLREGAPGSDG